MYIHRTKTIHADEIFRSQVTKLLVPPFTDEEKEKIDNIKNLDFEITGHKLEIYGICKECRKH